MLRTSIIQFARTFARPHVYSSSFRPSIVQSVRFGTTKPPESKPSPQQELKAAQELNDNLQRDWDAKEVSYEMLKPRTNSPTPVSIHTILGSVIHGQVVGRIFDRCPGTWWGDPRNDPLSSQFTTFFVGKFFAPSPWGLPRETWFWKAKEGPRNYFLLQKW